MDDRNPGLTPMTSKRPKRDVENNEFFGFAQRIMAAAGRRVAAGDIEALPILLDLEHEVQLATVHAVIGLRLDGGFSWQDIADRLGTSRQAASKRWGDVVAREAKRRAAQASVSPID